MAKQRHTHSWTKWHPVRNTNGQRVNMRKRCCTECGVTEYQGISAVGGKRK